jgi:hypothetical protein
LTSEDGLGGGGEEGRVKHREGQRDKEPEWKREVYGA